MLRLGLAMAGYAALAALEWKTLTEPKIRAVALAITGLFAVLTWTQHLRQQREKQDEEDDGL
jgi:hypothetical protein